LVKQPKAAVIIVLAFGLTKEGGGGWLCSLHYAVVALGTPNVTFLVALDTGSDLFWVPCDCVKCAPLTSPDYGVRTIFRLHSFVLFWFVCYSS
jgi:hypothetical protein